MKKLFIPALVSALIAGCSSTLANETSGAPVDSRSGSDTAPAPGGFGPFGPFNN